MMSVIMSKYILVQHFVQLCLTLAVSKLMVDSHHGQYLRGTGEMC